MAGLQAEYYKTLIFQCIFMIEPISYDWFSWILYSLRIIEDPKELVFVWIISNSIHYIRN